jgi:DNA repair protein RadD
VDWHAGLRPRQIKAVQDIQQSYRSGFIAPTLVASTGFGKSHTAATIIRMAIARGKRVWFIAHLREILQSTSAKLTAENIPHGWIAAGAAGNRRLPTQVVMIQTLARRLDSYEPPDMLIIDEAHLAVSDTYQTVMEWARSGPKFYRAGGAYMLNLTATPCRLDGRGLGEISDLLIPTCSTQTLINEGLLARLRYLKPGRPDLSGVHSRGGEYVSSEISELMQKPHVVGSAVEHYRQHGAGRPGLGFAVDVASARRMADEFSRAGFRSVAVCGEDDPVSRDQALTGIQTGQLDFVWNAKLWIAGVDAPAISYISDMAPTKSLTRYRQGLGRGMRTHPGKIDLVYADHAGNYDTHGNPLADVEWTLAGAGRSESGKSEVTIKTCPKCFSTLASNREACKCGHVFETKPREVEEREGQLEEINLDEIASVHARVQQGTSKTRDDLIALGRSRGHASPERWADYILAGRARKKAREELARSSVKEVAARLGIR